jgi:adenosine deaminase
MGIQEALSFADRQKLREDLLAANDKFVLAIPKTELHVHIEGTLTLDLRWKLTQRNGTTLRLVPTGPELKSLEELHAAIDSIMPEASRMDDGEERDIFFESYFEGFQALKMKEDFYDLAMNYFEHVASMNVRYCEPFFDPQGHTSRGVPWNEMMDGFRQAQKDAEEKLNVCIVLHQSTRSDTIDCVDRSNQVGSCASSAISLPNRLWNITRRHYHTAI